MRIGFRQGLISFQTDAGTPVYLEPSSTSGFVSHVITPTPTLVAVAHGSSDYLLKFDDSVTNAWGPLIPGETNHLYWDIDVLTTHVTHGLTVLEPVYSLTEPETPGNDQHWFDANVNIMKVWSVSKNKWIEKIRVFAGKVLNGNVNTIVMYSAGSQAGLTQPANPGYILLDSMLQPLRKASQNGEFLTDDDEARVMSTVGTSGVLVSPVNKVIPVRAGENIPRMSLVYFSADDTVRLASSNPALIPSRPPVGIMIDALVSGEVGTLVQSGEISYDQWDFVGSAGQPVYCDSFGQVSLTRPSGLMAFRVGFVKNRRTLLVNVDAETNPQVYTATTAQVIIAGTTPVSTTDTTNGIGERVVTISVSNATNTTPGLMSAASVIQLDSHNTRIDTAESDILSLMTSKSDVGHTHVIANVDGLQAALDDKSNVSHDHDLVYSALNHDHDLVYALLEHSHLVGDVDGLQTALDQRAYRAHLTAISEIFTSVNRTGTFDIGSGGTLQTVLDGKAATSHNHDVSDVTGLQTALDGKAATSHNHAIGNLTGVDFSTAPNTNDVLQFNGTAWKPAAVTQHDRLAIVDNHNTDNVNDANEASATDVSSLVFGNGIRVREIIDLGAQGKVVRLSASIRPVNLNAAVSAPSVFTFQYHPTQASMLYWANYQASIYGSSTPVGGTFVTTDGQNPTVTFNGTGLESTFSNGWDAQNVRINPTTQLTSPTVTVWEFTIGNIGTNGGFVGYFVRNSGAAFNANGIKRDGAWYNAYGEIYEFGGYSSGHPTFGEGDVIGCVYNPSLAKVQFYKNGALVYTANVGNDGGFPFCGSDNAS